MTRGWIQAVGDDNAGKLVMLVSNYQSTYQQPAKTDDIVLTEVRSLQQPSPKVGAGIFALAWVTDEQMDALGSGRSFDGALPPRLHRSAGKINILVTPGSARRASPITSDPARGGWTCGPAGTGRSS